MFNRTLQRPMFRIGGSAGTGITTGLRRQGYAFGSTGPQRQYLKDKATTSTNTIIPSDKSDRLRGDVSFLKSQMGDIPTREPYPYKASDFFMGLGSGILAQPGGQPIFQTIGKAAQVPLDQLSKTQMASWGQGEDDKIRQWQSDKEILLTAYKNTSQEEKDKLWITAKGYVKNKGINPETGEPFKTPQEAYTLLLKRELNAYRKDQSPAETLREKQEMDEKLFNTEVQSLVNRYDLGKDDAVKLRQFMEDNIAGKYKLPTGGSGGAGRPYHIEPDHVKKSGDPKEKRLLIKNYDPDRDDYEDNTIYLDFRSNIVYVKKGPLFIPYEDYIAETIDIQK